MRNKILTATAYTMAIIFIISASALDSESMLPVVLCVISQLWLLLFMVANRKKADRW